MAKTETETKAAEMPVQTKAEDFELPPHLTLDSANKYCGDADAATFHREVAIAGMFGETAGMDVQDLDLKGLVIAANDPKNTQAELSKRAVRQVTAVFRKYQK